MFLMRADTLRREVGGGLALEIESFLGPFEMAASWKASAVLVPKNSPMQKKNLLYRHDKLNEPNKEGPLSFVFFESPFSSVSTDIRGHPSPSGY